MIEKYNFIKSFNSPINYEKTHLDELKILQLIDARYNETKEKCEELNHG